MTEAKERINQYEEIGRLDIEEESKNIMKRRILLNSPNVCKSANGEKNMNVIEKTFKKLGLTCACRRLRQARFDISWEQYHFADLVEIIEAQCANMLDLRMEALELQDEIAKLKHEANGGSK